MAEFHDIIWVVVFFKVGDAISHGWKGASEDSDCFHLGVCQVTGVKVAGCHIGLELLTPIEVGTRYDPGIEEPAPRSSVRNVAIRLPNLCSIVSVTDSISKNNPWRLVRQLRLAHLAHITSTANQDATTETN